MLGWASFPGEVGVVAAQEVDLVPGLVFHWEVKTGSRDSCFRVDLWLGQAFTLHVSGEMRAESLRVWLERF